MQRRLGGRARQRAGGGRWRGRARTAAGFGLRRSWTGSPSLGGTERTPCRVRARNLWYRCRVGSAGGRLREGVVWMEREVALVVVRHRSKRVFCALTLLLEGEERGARPPQGIVVGTGVDRCGGRRSRRRRASSWRRTRRWKGARRWPRTTPSVCCRRATRNCFACTLRLARETTSMPCSVLLNELRGR